MLDLIKSFSLNHVSSGTVWIGSMHCSIENLSGRKPLQLWKAGTICFYREWNLSDFFAGKLRWSEIHKVSRDFRWRFYCKCSRVTISSLKQIQNSNNCSMNWQAAFCCLFACFSREKIKSKCKVWNQPSLALRVFELSVFSRCAIEIFISWVHYAGVLINVLWH